MKDMTVDEALEVLVELNASHHEIIISSDDPFVVEDFGRVIATLVREGQRRQSEQ